MLNTLVKIGQQQLAKHNKFASLVYGDKDFKVRKGKVAIFQEIVLDLDRYSETTERIQSEEDLTKAAIESVYPGERRTSESVNAEWRWDVGCVKRLGGPSVNSHYPAVKIKEAFGLRKTLFGKKNNNSLLLAWLGDYADEEIHEIINAVQVLKPGFDWILAADDEFKASSIESRLSISPNEQAVLLYSSVKWTEGGYPEPTPIAQIGNFQSVYLTRRVEIDEAKGDRLCFISGECNAPNSKPKFDGRINISKTFVTETINYSSNFDGKRFDRNFRINGETQVALNAASDYLLNNLSVRIADVRHVIIPSWLSGQELDDAAITGIESKADLLFSFQQLKNITTPLEKASENEGADFPFWITLLGYESNGTFFKVVNTIQDVPSFYFNCLHKELEIMRRDMLAIVGKQFFNFYTIYHQIPILKETARSEALQFLKAILEQRPIANDTLWKHFAVLARCHFYGSYKKYKNISDETEWAEGKGLEPADVGWIQTVRIYTLLRLYLSRLQLLEGAQYTVSPQNINLYDMPENAQEWCEKLGLTARQKALFYLGQALNSMALAQKKKGNAKRILQKVNFNGMHAEDLFTLHNDLVENASVYRDDYYGTVLDRIRDDLSRFSEGFDRNTWTHDSKMGDNQQVDPAISPEEALYWLLSGYTYRRPKNDNEDPEQS